MVHNKYIKSCDPTDKVQLSTSNHKIHLCIIIKYSST